MEYDEIKSRSEWKQDLNYLLIWILIRCWTSTIRLSMDSSPNLVSERSSGCAPQNSNGIFETPRTTRADSNSARTGNSSSNGEVSTQSVLIGSFFGLQILAARHRIMCAMHISPWDTHALCWQFERWSVCGPCALLRGALRFFQLFSLILGSQYFCTQK